MTQKYTAVLIKGAVGLPGNSVDFQIQADTADDAMDQLDALTQRVEQRFKNSVSIWKTEIDAVDAAKGEEK